MTTYVLLNLVMIMNHADERLLPAVYYEVCSEFGVGPGFLGMVTAFRGIAQALVAVFAGPIAHRFDRVRLVGLGSIFWGASTALVGASPSVGMLLLGRALNGLGLGLVTPVVYSLISDMVPTHRRGRAYGLLNFCGGVGGTLGSLFATELAGRPAGTGLAGWRVAFHAIAAVSVAIGIATLRFGHSPHAGARAPGPGGSPAGLRATLRHSWEEARWVLRLRTFRVIIAQGAVGSAPWQSMSFLTLFLELRGFTHHAAAVTRSLFDWGATFGTLLGGFLIDIAGRVSPNHGKVVVAQAGQRTPTPAHSPLLRC